MIQEWKLNLDTASYLKNIDKRIKTSIKEKGFDRHDGQECWPESIIEDMKWFPFQGIMLNAADNIECPEEQLKILLKVFSMFKINIICDETIYNENVLETVGIICINYGEKIGCLLDSHNIEYFITPFSTNMMFQHIDLFYIIKYKNSYILFSTELSFLDT